GERVTLFPASQDHKRLEEGDLGPNTGGMGAYSPVSVATSALLERITSDVLQPTLAEMRRRGTPYRGLLYAGLMIDETGAPSVVEFNCRFGDPETQVVLPLVRGGLTDCLENVALGGRPESLDIDHGSYAVTTVLSAQGYPARPEKGAAITIPDDLPDGVTVFHAGTTMDEAGVLRVNGGRVLNVTAVADSFARAQRLSREAAERINFEGRVFRRDIGWRETGRQQAAGSRQL
ncbi:MAG: phosphoribosylamine--glycine ligase, partial [Gemmatimonadales bacterium]